MALVTVLIFFTASLLSLNFSQYCAQTGSHQLRDILYYLFLVLPFIFTVLFNISLKMHCREELSGWLFVLIPTVVVALVCTYFLSGHLTLAFRIYS
jgi:hypothetical protein